MGGCHLVKSGESLLATRSPNNAHRKGKGKMKGIKRSKGKVLIGALLIVALALTVLAPVAQANDTMTITVQLLDHNGHGLAGGNVKYAEGSWKTFGTTGSDGTISKDFPSETTNLKVRVTYNQGSQQKSQNIQTNPLFTFQTVEATVKLIDHAGNGLSGGKVDQGGGYWQHHGYTDTSGEFKLEMFPGGYKFRLGYNHTSQQKTQNISTPVTFQTGQVHWTGASPSPVKASLGGKWVGFTQDMELLPGNYKFVFGDGSSQIISVTAGSIISIPTAINQPPMLDPIGDKTVDEGQLLEFTISATDTDSESLTYSASNLPSGATFNPATRTFSWTPGYDQAGAYPDVHFAISDGSLTDSEDITITVVNVVPMSEFQIDHAKIDFKKKVDDDKVRVKGKLALANGYSVDIGDDVIVTVGPLSETITMVEKGKKGDKWEYKRPKGGTGDIKHMTIDWKNGKFDIRMDKADLTGVTNPVTISVQIGDDVGEETITMREKKHHWDYKVSKSPKPPKP